MKHLIMGTAGHVDHGKTSLIKALTSIDCDTHKQEKDRGITINLGFSHLDFDDGSSIGIIDVPGHKDFVNTMLSGASGFDFVLLVIAADSGIMPQTIEHFNIINALGIKKMIIALTKIDLVDDEWKDLAKMEIIEWLESTAFAQSPLIEVSSKKSIGLDNLIHEMKTTIHQIPKRSVSSFFRMYIDRIFSVKGKGTVVAGSVLNGKLNAEKEVYCLPGDKKLKIKDIQRHGIAVDTIFPGNRAAINVRGFKRDEFKRGMLLSNVELLSTNRIDVQLELFTDIKSVKLWSNVIFHSATIECQARMHLMDTDNLDAGNSCIAQLNLDKKVVLLPKDRFVIRRTSGDETIGGGMVLDIKPNHHRKRTQKLLNELQLLRDALLNENKLNDLLLVALKKAGKPINKKNLLEQLKMEPADLKLDLNSLIGINYYPKTEIFTSNVFEQQTETKLIRLLKEYHVQNPFLVTGMSKMELLGKFQNHGDPDFNVFFELFLEKLVDLKKLTKLHNTYFLSSHKVELNANSLKAIEDLENLFKDYGTQKPVYTEIKEKIKERSLSNEKFQQYLSYLVSTKKLCLFKGDYVHTSWVNLFRKNMLKVLLESDNGLYNQALKEKTDLPKKMIQFMIELLESEKLIKTSNYNKNNFKTEISSLGKQLFSKYV
jgi:selenocysteine-specific elongation factor